MEDGKMNWHIGGGIGFGIQGMEVRVSEFTLRVQGLK